MTRSEALARLRASRDADHDAPIWADRGRSVRMLAEAAGVRVVYAHVNLSALTTERQTVEPKGATNESVL
jgi:hypothetical protein